MKLFLQFSLKALLSLLLIGAPMQVANASADHQGPPIDIRGKITDESGQPLIGATVLEKGTTNGTVTDFD